jgi:hypothetical protein
VLGHAAIAICAILGSIDRSSDPRFDYKYHAHPADFVVPIHDIAIWCGVIAVELLIASWVVLRARSTAAASLGLAAIAGTSFVVMLPLTMHAPSYFAFHVIFLLASAIWLIVVAIVARIASAGPRSSA